MIFKFLKDFESILYEDILRRNKATPFLIFISLLPTFIFYRFYAIIYPYLGFSIIVKDYHFHHFYFGVLLISIACWVALVSDKRRMHRLAAISFGIGLGMIIDEFGLLVTCGSLAMECDYWNRLSYDAFVVVSVVFLMIIYFEPFWRKIGRKAFQKLLGLFGFGRKTRIKISYK